MTAITATDVERAGLAWFADAGWRLGHGSSIASGTPGAQVERPPANACGAEGASMSRIAMRVVEILLSFVPVAIRQRFRPTRNPHLAIYRKRDAERNSATTPPEDECVDLCCAWGIEFYTPTYIPNLIEGFRELGWHTNDHNDPRREPEAWLWRLRRFQFGRFLDQTWVPRTK